MAKLENVVPMATSWLKSWVTEAPPDRNESLVVADSLVMELEYQMREIEQQVWAREKEKKRKTSGVDYSWLVTSQPKAYEIPQLERLELEELCMKVKPIESGRVITMFRDALLREPEVWEVSRILRACIHHVIDSRPKEETMPEWMMKSLTKLKPSTRVAPLNVPSGDCEMQRPQVIGHDDTEIPAFQRVQNLPV